VGDGGAEGALGEAVFALAQLVLGRGQPILDAQPV
jgi:hypothetical protein